MGEKRKRKKKEGEKKRKKGMEVGPGVTQWYLSVRGWSGIWTEEGASRSPGAGARRPRAELVGEAQFLEGPPGGTYSPRPSPAAEAARSRVREDLALRGQRDSAGHSPGAQGHQPFPASRFTVGESEAQGQTGSPD